jgi:hypothetical protein
VVKGVFAGLGMGQRRASAVMMPNGRVGFFTGRRTGNGNRCSRAQINLSAFGFGEVLASIAI